MSEVLKWWESLHTFWQAAIPICVTILLGLAGFFLKRLIHFIASVIKRKKEIDDQNLYLHFDEVKNEAKGKVSAARSITEFYGALISSSPSMYMIDGNLTNESLTELQIASPALKAHFPKDVKNFEWLAVKVKEHNTRFFNLKKQVLRDVTEQGIAVLDSSKIKMTPRNCIYTQIFTPLYAWWCSLNREDVNPWSGFRNLDVDNDTGNIFPQNWHSQAIAHAKTEYGRKKCIRIIRKIALNKDYPHEVKLIMLGIDILLVNKEKLAQEMLDKINEIENYWLGTKQRKFKKIKHCPRCKEIF